jgi:pimeloyl-ACP methyl ester carboxylesterase
VSDRPLAPALVFHYGTPSGLVAFPPLVEAAEARGMRLMVCARPGYERSTPAPSRRVADVVPDIAAVLDQLGVDEFVTCGWSGGGPHALACAALLPDRCRRAATIASVAPHGADGLDWLEGMGPENIEEFDAAVKGEEVLVSFLESSAGLLATVEADSVVASVEGLLPEVDRACLRGEFAEFMAASLRAGVASGVAGWRDDDLAFIQDWGFDIASASRATLWQGSEDKMVPFSHGRWLAGALPSATAHLLEGEGHLSLAVNSIGDILDDLAAA